MKRLLLILLATAALAFAADLTGKWTFDVETDMGSGSPTFVLKQDGEKLTGTYHGQFGEAPLTGTVKGDKMEFSFEAAPTGEKMKIVYTGTIAANNTIEGSVDYGGGQLKGTFKARKQ